MQGAILLGSVRKSMSLLDRLDGGPVLSLRYFASLLGEVRTESFPAGTWSSTFAAASGPGKSGAGKRSGESVQIWQMQIRLGRSGNPHLPPAKPESERDDDDLVLR